MNEKVHDDPTNTSGRRITVVGVNERLADKIHVGVVYDLERFLFD